MLCRVFYEFEEQSRDGNHHQAHKGKHQEGNAHAERMGNVSDNGWTNQHSNDAVCCDDRDGESGRILSAVTGEGERHRNYSCGSKSDEAEADQ